MRIGIAALAGALWLVLPAHGWAHEIQPAFLELRQSDATTFHVIWKVPSRGNVAAGIELVLPAKCRRTSETVSFRTRTDLVERFTLDCPGGLVGERIAIEGPLAKLLDVLVRIVRPDGTARVVRLTPADPALVIEAAPSRWRTAASYLRLGLDHILMGVDHLLFVLGLLLLVRGPGDGARGTREAGAIPSHLATRTSHLSSRTSTLIKTITSFTIAHSITLAIATLGYASAPLPPLNAAIALSILFLGPEIMRFRRGQSSLTIEHPWVVAFAFGLLHGFGFASGLTALGLPAGEIPWALLLFNVGVETGQLLFVMLILLLERSFRTLEIRWPQWAVALPPYTIGTLGAYWTIQRIVLMFAR